MIAFSGNTQCFITISLTFFPLQDGMLTFDSFLRAGLIEYLDVNEENNALVCSVALTVVITSVAHYSY